MRGSEQPPHRIAARAAQKHRRPRPHRPWLLLLLLFIFLVAELQESPTGIAVYVDAFGEAPESLGVGGDLARPLPEVVPYLQQPKGDAVSSCQKEGHHVRLPSGSCQVQWCFALVRLCGQMAASREQDLQDGQVTTLATEMQSSEACICLGINAGSQLEQGRNTARMACKGSDMQTSTPIKSPSVWVDLV